MFATLVLLTSMLITTNTVTVNRYTEQIISKSKVQLAPILVECSLGDIVIISAPIVHTKEKIYYLTNAKGETRKLPIHYTQFVVKKKKRKSLDYENVVIKYIKQDARVLSPENSYKVFNVNSNDIFRNDSNEFSEQLSDMDPNEFMIGPLLEEDYGNWMLRLLFKDIDDQWIELFQVITIEISESIFTEPRRPKMKIGDTLQLSFAYPIEGLESCELRAPLSTYDRYYERNRIDLDKYKNCEFIIRNITSTDQGVWTIVGVGRIMYIAQTMLLIQ